MPQTIKPATALPWTYKDQHGGNMPQMEHPTRVQFGRGGVDTGSHVGEVYVWKRDTQKAAQDAAYIVHAANSLPVLVEQNRRLVEALRYLVNPPSVEAKDATPEHVSAILNAFDNARNLLRELGGE